MAKNDSIFAVERQQQIMEIINRNKRIVVPELAELFGVSATTIRKDLKALEDANLITRTHGGALCISKARYESSPATKATIMSPQKQAIAAKAIEYIEDGDTVALLTGTTVMELVKLLPQKKDLTVIVNDIQFASWLQQNSDFRIYILSGLLRNNYNYVTSPMKCELLSILNIDKAFITCNGFTKEAGATTPDLANALKIKEVLDRSCSIYLLCDSSKIGSVSFAQIVSVDQIDVFFTDSGISEDDAVSIGNSVCTVIAQVE
mgnify:CR=1 FL=1